MVNNLVEKLKDTFHPNRISFSGLLMSVTSVALMSHPDTAFGGFCLLSSSYLTDWLDGYTARSWNRKTKIGAKLDPLIDKGKFIIATGTGAAMEVSKGNYFFPASFLASVVVDGISQKQRGNLGSQIEEAYKGIIYPGKCEKDRKVHSTTRANCFGKMKTGIQTLTTLTYWGHEVLKNLDSPMMNNYIKEMNWGENNLGYVLGGALIGSAILGSVGVVKRIRNNKGNLEENVEFLKEETL